MRYEYQIVRAKADHNVLGEIQTLADEGYKVIHFVINSDTHPLVLMERPRK